MKCLTENLLSKRLIKRGLIPVEVSIGFQLRPPNDNLVRYVDLILTAGQFKNFFVKIAWKHQRPVALECCPPEKMIRVVDSSNARFGLAHEAAVPFSCVSPRTFKLPIL